MSPIRPRARLTLILSVSLGLGVAGVLGSAAAQPKAGPPANAALAPAASPADVTVTATTRALEGAAESATGILESFELTRRVRWSYEDHLVGAYGILDDGAEAQPIAAYEGPQVGTLKAKLRFERGAARDLVAMVAPLERMAAEDPQLGRPPRVVFTTRGIEFKGVVESVALRCTSTRCEADVTLREAEGAKVRAPAARAQAGDPARLPDF
jgi:hypothetical protein